MKQSDQFDNTVWGELVGRVTELRDNPAGCDHLVYRFLGQYLPALLSARTQEARERVWSALWSYLTTPATRAKPFAMSSSSADDLIAVIQMELNRQWYQEQG